MTQIIACIDHSPLAHSVCDYAIWASQRLAAPLHFLHVLDQGRYPAPRDYTGAIGLGSREHLLDELADLDAKRIGVARIQGQDLLDAAKERARAAGVAESHCRQRHGDLVESVVALEDDTRLLVMGREGEGAQQDGDSARSHIGSHIETLVRSLHKPILVIPTDFVRPERFLIAFDGSETSRKTVEMIAASPLLTGLTCHILMLGAATPEAQAALGWAQTQLQQAGYKPVVKLMSGVLGDMLPVYCVAEQIELVAMGAYGHSRVRQFFVGSNTSHLLRRMNIPLLLLR